MKTKAHQQYHLKDGTLVPGVTTVLGSILAKPALIHWAWKLGMEQIDYKKFKDDKADIGTLAHQMIEDHLLGKETEKADYSKNQIDAAENSFLSWLEWEKQHPIVKVHFVEEQLVSEIFRFGGTQDIYCSIQENGKPQEEVIDLKTGSGIYDEAVFQVAALKVLLEEHGHKVDRCRIINVPRSEDEAFLEKVLSPDELQFGWEIFCNCLNIYNLKKAIKDNGKGGKKNGIR